MPSIESLPAALAAGFSKEQTAPIHLSGCVTDLSFSRAQTELCQSQLNQHGQGAVKAVPVPDEPHARRARPPIFGIVIAGNLV